MKTLRTMGLWSLAAGLCAVLPARADVQYVTETRLPGQSNVKPLNTVTTFRKDGAERVETVSRLGNFEQRMVTVTLCDKHQMLTFNPDLKLYHETAMVKTPAEAADEKANTTDKKVADKTTGNITMTLVSIRALDDQKIGEVTAKCYEVITRMQASGCAGDADVTTKQEICAAENEALGGGGCDGYQADTENDGDGDNCKLSFTRKGDWTLYNKIMGQLQLRVRNTVGEDKSTVETQSKIVSRAQLSDDLFTVPDGFKKVTAQEFQKAQSAAMMKQLMGGMATGMGTAEDDKE